MTPSISNVWFDLFPSARIPEVLAYVAATWGSLHQQYAKAVSFENGETALTDNLCHALQDRRRRRANNIDCDFQPETWEFRRDSKGFTTRVARADIRVVLGAPGTPHLVMEFKKLDGTGRSRGLYCFDGMNRFVEGKYAQDHAVGVMCGFSLNDVKAEATAMSAYICKANYPARLQCIKDGSGNFVTAPSSSNAVCSHFDTHHNRPTVGSKSTILLLHTFLPCPNFKTRRVVKPVKKPSASSKPRPANAARKKP